MQEQDQYAESEQTATKQNWKGSGTKRFVGKGDFNLQSKIEVNCSTDEQKQNKKALTH
jgi:hypothetical protein